MKYSLSSNRILQLVNRGPKLRFFMNPKLENLDPRWLLRYRNLHGIIAFFSKDIAIGEIDAGTGLKQRFEWRKVKLKRAIG